jgi:ribosome-associated protein
MEHTVIHITDTIALDDGEVEERFVRAIGARGQNVRKEATAVELRFDVEHSSLPADVKRRLLDLGGRHLTTDRVLVVVSRADRSQIKNRETARARLLALVKRASTPPAARTPTAISRLERLKREAFKQRHSALKRARRGGDRD